MRELEKWFSLHVFVQRSYLQIFSRAKYVISIERALLLQHYMLIDTGDR